ncbi:MAG: ribbon-helix-helix protein, CopG family [Anaerolineae bacterium]|nr:ribbon-helix-helix protein, CopG family [Anaerolineae bacterium]
MVRTQVLLTEEQPERLQTLAAKRGQSASELVRQCTDTALRSYTEIGEAAKRQRGLEVVGAFRSGKSDISARHDDYLAKDYAGCASS